MNQQIGQIIDRAATEILNKLRLDLTSIADLAEAQIRRSCTMAFQDIGKALEPTTAAAPKEAKPDSTVAEVIEQEERI